MKLAVIGSGISGLVAAYLLAPDHDLTVFEANDYIGGHTHTHRCEQAGRAYAVDTGFIVFNDKTYPNLIRLLDRLGVASQPSEMSFSVRCEASGLEYNGRSLNGLFIQRSNLVRPGFYRMVRDIFRFYRDARELLTPGDEGLTLGDFIRRRGYSREFVEKHLVPIGAAIWSADPGGFERFPARFLARFFDNHGMLQMSGRPNWRVIRGGSSQYVEPLTAGFRDRIRLKTAIQSVRRCVDHVEVRPAGGEPERFDRVILATHSDQALKMLSDATADEREILGAIPYQRNTVTLHTDERMLPTRRGAWASWNYHIPRAASGAAASRATVTYDMNILESLDAPRQFCVTLNRDGEIDERLKIRTLEYDHPVFLPQSVAAQARHERINGVNRTYFCGAYWGFGFHEDGVKSALAVCKHFGKGL